jgi:hypothetical protein
MLELATDTGADVGQVPQASVALSPPVGFFENGEEKCLTKGTEAVL